MNTENLLDGTSDRRVSHADTPDAVNKDLIDGGHAGTDPEPSDSERIKGVASDQTSDAQTSDQQTSTLEKAGDERAPPELTRLQTFVVVLAICVRGLASDCCLSGLTLRCSCLSSWLLST
jgi:hypothetical protein